MLSASSADLNLTPGQAGSLGTWTLIGAVVGGFFFGAMSDRYGRIRVLTWTIVLFAVFTGLCAFAQGYWDLLVYRTIAGIGLGGDLKTTQMWRQEDEALTFVQGFLHVLSALPDDLHWLTQPQAGKFGHELATFCHSAPRLLPA